MVTLRLIASISAYTKLRNLLKTIKENKAPSLRMEQVGILHALNSLYW